MLVLSEESFWQAVNQKIENQKKNIYQKENIYLLSFTRVKNKCSI